MLSGVVIDIVLKIDLIDGVYLLSRECSMRQWLSQKILAIKVGTSVYLDRLPCRPTSLVLYLPQALALVKVIIKMLYFY